ncbi:MAG: hypothetical protein ACE5I0_08265, partial [Candidatus Binatia bacterium]
MESRRKLLVFCKLNNLVIPVYWLFMYLLISQGSFPGLVLCFGENGHAAVEMPHMRSEDPESQQHGEPHLDLPLTVSQFVVSAHSPTLQCVFPVLAIFSLHLQPVAHGLLSGTPPHQVSPPNPRLAFMHTVILII